MMAIAARSSHAGVQRCHGGVSSLVRVVSNDRDDGVAILSSCVFINENVATSWEIAKRRGEKLGVDVAALRKAYDQTPRLTGEKLDLANALLDIAAEAVREVQGRLDAEARAGTGQPGSDPASRGIEATVRKELREALSTLRHERDPRLGALRRAPSTLMAIVSDLIAQKPNMPFSVGAIAAACRMTPNHFSHLFHQQHKQCFSDFLTEQRLGLARELLKDLTLSVSEVAFKAGFRDAGYFARRFRQAHRVSPRQWRQRLERVGRAAAVSPRAPDSPRRGRPARVS